MDVKLALSPMLLGMRYRIISPIQKFSIGEIVSYMGPVILVDGRPGLSLALPNGNEISVHNPWPEDHPEEWKKYFEPIDHFHFEGTKFIINPGTKDPIELVFEHDVLSVIEFDDIFTVLLKHTSSYKAEIYGIDKIGKIVWKSLPPNEKIPARSWMDIWRGGNMNIMYAGDPTGWVYELEPRTGKVIAEFFAK